MPKPKRSHASPLIERVVEGPAPTPASTAAIVIDAARHLVPLVQFYAFGGSIGRYVLLTAFDLGLGLIFIVGSTREPSDINSVDPRSRWPVLQIVSVLVLAPFLAFMGAVIAIPVALPAYLVGVRAGIDWLGILTSIDLWVQVGVMALLAATRSQVLFYERTSPGRLGPPTSTGPVLGDLEDDRRRSLADKAAQTTLLATFAALCYALIVFGPGALSALPALYAAMLVFYDARPDLAQKLFPALWQEK